MGSGTSKPRTGHEHPPHLPKVGSPANRAWEHETHEKVDFGSNVGLIFIGVLVIGAIAGLLILNL
jgi:hypothetical protein